ncbi:MAG: hypothetical protein QME74_03330, partial [Candidatus Edwardsbacteria bacterium]|nr:hypothetical protein [Candidatus Edwardsbacteria bacterium]
RLKHDGAHGVGVSGDDGVHCNAVISLDSGCRLTYNVQMNETKILKLSSDSPDEELAFELQFMKSLSIQQRFDMMVQRSREIKEMMIANGSLRPVEIVKRS